MVVKFWTCILKVPSSDHGQVLTILAELFNSFLQSLKDGS
jgi:hypothetical protein